MLTKLNLLHRKKIVSVEFLQERSKEWYERVARNLYKSNGNDSNQRNVGRGNMGDQMDIGDDFYILMLSDEQEISPVSDERYAEELQLQEVIFSSLIAAQVSEIVDLSTRISISMEQKERSNIIAKIDKGESSGVICGICMDRKPSKELFNNLSCIHSFCHECVSKYVTTKIQENVPNFHCPEINCKALIEPGSCREIIPSEVFERWNAVLCEATIHLSERFYCPFKDCSALLLNDGEERLTRSECPNCHRLFCVQCRIPWHDNFSCTDYLALNENERVTEDLMAIALANKYHWRRCPECHFYVEKTSGCSHIQCRCKYEFCYQCGSRWSSTHNSLHS